MQKNPVSCHVIDIIGLSKEQRNAIPGDLQSIMQIIQPTVEAPEEVWLQHFEAMCDSEMRALGKLTQCCFPSCTSSPGLYWEVCLLNEPVCFSSLLRMCSDISKWNKLHLEFPRTCFYFSHI